MGPQIPFRGQYPCRERGTRGRSSLGERCEIEERYRASFQVFSAMSETDQQVVSVKPQPGTPFEATATYPRHFPSLEKAMAFMESELQGVQVCSSTVAGSSRLQRGARKFSTDVVAKFLPWVDKDQQKGDRAVGGALTIQDSDEEDAEGALQGRELSKRRRIHKAGLCSDPEGSERPKAGKKRVSTAYVTDLVSKQTAANAAAEEEAKATRAKRQPPKDFREASSAFRDAIAFSLQSDEGHQILREAGLASVSPAEAKRRRGNGNSPNALSLPDSPRTSPNDRQLSSEEIPQGAADTQCAITDVQAVDEENQGSGRRGGQQSEARLDYSMHAKAEAEAPLYGVAGHKLEDSGMKQTSNWSQYATGPSGSAEAIDQAAACQASSARGREVLDQLLDCARDSNPVSNIPDQFHSADEWVESQAVREDKPAEQALQPSSKLAASHSEDRIAATPTVTPVSPPPKPSGNGRKIRQLLRQHKHQQPLACSSPPGSSERSQRAQFGGTEL